MDRSQLERLARCLARPDVAAHDPGHFRVLARALSDADPPVSVGRHGSVVGYVPGPGRRRLLELDRGDGLVAVHAWGDDGRLRWAKSRAVDGRWLGIEPGAAHGSAWGRSDRVWRLDDTEPWSPVEPLTMFQALDYARLDRIPPLAEPRRLGAGGGTALLNLLAGLMKDQGAARVRYAGPYPTEQLFTALLESFRYDAEIEAPFERFLSGEPLDWTPAPHERHEVAPGVWVQLRHQVEKVVIHGAPFYRRGWQGVERRETRVVRDEGDRVICSLWALGRPLEDRLILEPSGELIETREPAIDARPPAPLPAVWRTPLAVLIARESAAALGPTIAEATSALALEWGPVPGDLVATEPGRARLSRRLRDLAAESIRGAAPGAARAERAARFILEVARLLAPAVRLDAQLRLEALPEEEQFQRWETAAPAAGPLDDSVGRLVALVASGQA